MLVTGGWFGPNQERVVYKYTMGLSFDWEESFRYVSGDTEMAHHDGMEYLNGYLYLADYTGDYILQFDPNSSGVVAPENIFYHEPLSHELEGMGHGALNHYWVGSHGSVITEFGAGELGGVSIGNDVTVSASHNITVTFDTVTGTGNISGVQDPNPPASPQGFNPVGPAYEMIFTGTFADFVTVCLSYDDTGITDTEDNLKLFHYEESSWVDITTSLDTETNVICGTTDSFSPFMVVEPEEVDIPGDLDGNGIVDRLDIMIINSHRNQPASVCPDCDIDGDGTITVLDARKLMRMCTNARCASN